MHISIGAHKTLAYLLSQKIRRPFKAFDVCLKNHIRASVVESTKEDACERIKNKWNTYLF